ncbi:MAG: hypothetical protein ACI8QC_004516 [Planctomycetota bacterium]|jgi:hypothetical protein
MSLPFGAWNSTLFGVLARVAFACSVLVAGLWAVAREPAVTSPTVPFEGMWQDADPGVCSHRGVDDGELRLVPGTYAEQGDSLSECLNVREDGTYGYMDFMCHFTNWERVTIWRQMTTYVSFSAGLYRNDQYIIGGLRMVGGRLSVHVKSPNGPCRLLVSRSI